METKNPTVAVVMCTYNGEKYLREQMDSILAQTYPIHEIIVQDDRSTDGTAPCCACAACACATAPPCYPPPPARARGWRGAIRGFFYPFIFAWHCSQFDME